MVDYEVRGRVGLLTINRPEARNAVNQAVAEGMEAAIDRLEEDDDVWAGVLTGAGKAFSAGADLKEIAAGNPGALATKRGGFGGIVVREREKPIVAAVDGPALAGGTEIVLACDLVVASTAARFGIPEVKRSLVAAAGGVFRLPERLPLNIAMELAITGDPISAERAHHFGLVNELCEPGQAVEAAMAMAERICANAPLAVRKSRALLLSALGVDVPAGIDASLAASADLGGTEDFAEGPLAFIEKREPNWKGR